MIKDGARRGPHLDARESIGGKEKKGGIISWLQPSAIAATGYCIFLYL